MGHESVIKDLRAKRNCNDFILYLHVTYGEVTGVLESTMTASCVQMMIVFTVVRNVTVRCVINN
jgi:hypothetical protein